MNDSPSTPTSLPSSRSITQLSTASSVSSTTSSSSSSVVSSSFASSPKSSKKVYSIQRLFQIGAAILIVSVIILRKSYILTTLSSSSSSTSSSLLFEEISISEFFGPSKFIFVVGLPRSGSDAIHTYFACNHVTSSHYCCHDNERTGISRTKTLQQQQQHNLQFQYQNQEQQQQQRRNNPNNKFPCNENSITCGECLYRNVIKGSAPFDKCSTKSYGLQVYSQFDAETSDPLSWFLPQHYLLPLLYEAYDPEHTVWILNYRTSAKVWASNVLHWYSVTRRLLRAFHIDYYMSLDDNTVKYAPKRNLTIDVLHKALEKSYERSHDPKEHNRRYDLLIQIYNEHLEKVRSFATTYGQPYIELNVDDPNASTVLSTAALLLTKHTNSTSSVRSTYKWKNECWNFNATKLDNDWKDFTLFS